MVRIVHISDIHFDENYSTDIKKFILNPLVNDLKKYNAAKKIDLLLISGDLINKGAGTNDPIITFLEFEEAVINPILKAINLTNNSCFFVPGNHDIVRTLDSKFIEKGIDASLTNIESINQYIDANFRSCISEVDGIKRLAPFKEYEANFYQNYDEPFSLTNFGSSFIKTVNDTKIGITCFNSAWRSYDSSFDKGKLLLGERQITTSMEFIKNTDIKIAIIHHPLDWFHDVEKPYIKSFIDRDYDMLFCGHVHEGNSLLKITDLYNSIAISVAPANWEYGIRCNNSNFSNGYAIVDYEADLEITIHNRIYSYTKDSFVPNVNVGNESGKQILNVGNSIVKQKQSRKFQISKTIKDIHFPSLNEHLLSYHTETCAPKEINKLFVFPRLISKVNYDDINTPDEYVTKIEDVCSCEENIILLGTKESGKTIILDKLLINFTENIVKNHKIPVYFKFTDIQSRIETLVSKYLNVPILDINSFLVEERVVLLIDDVFFDKTSSPKLTKIEKFLNKYKNVSVIMTSMQRIYKDLPIELLEYPYFADFKKLHISEFKTKEIKQLINNWFSSSEKQSTPPKFRKILKTFLALNLPRTPLALSMFLWIIEQQENYKPINKAAMLENYIQNLFKKQKVTVFAGEFDYQNKERLLADIALEMYKSIKDHYCLDKTDLLMFIKKYLEIKKFNFDESSILSHFLNVGVLFEEKQKEKSCISFQFNCFFEYFLAKKMEFDSSFLDSVLLEDNFLKFVNEIDYYTGLKRDQIKLLEILLSRMNNEYKGLLTYIGELQHGFDTSFMSNSQKTHQDTLDLDIEKITEKDKPTENELDEIQDEALDALPVEDRGAKKNDVINPLTRLDKLWEVTAKVLKNTEEIDKPNFKYVGLKQVILCGMAFSCLYKYFLVQQLTKNSDNLYPKTIENIMLLDKFMPIVCQTLLYSFVGTGKLSLVLEEKIDKELNDPNISDYEKFISVFLLSDITTTLEEKNYSQIKNLIRVAKNTYIYELMILKILSYYILRSNTKESDIILLNLLSDLNIKLKKGNKIMHKGQIIEHYKQMKIDIKKNPEENDF